VAKPCLVILAAGMSTRYGDLKQLDRLGPNGETLIDYTIYDAVRAGFTHLVFVTRKAVEEAFRHTVVDGLPDEIDVDLVCQERDDLPAGMSAPSNRTKPWGTGHALLVTAPYVSSMFGVINADDFYGRSSFILLHDFLNSHREAQQAQALAVSFRLQKTLSDHGPVSRAICELDGDGNLCRLVERTHIKQTSTGIRFRDTSGQWKRLSGDLSVSMNMFALSPDIFRHFEDQFEIFLRENGGDPNSEFYLPDVLNRLVQSGELRLRVLQSEASWFGLTHSGDRELARARIKELIDRGEYPFHLWA
jgi:UTP-glucose-1-phosphate uridylyltransferase